MRLPEEARPLGPSLRIPAMSAVLSCGARADRGGGTPRLASERVVLAYVMSGS
jgi:hypothetical protein